MWSFMKNILILFTLLTNSLFGETDFITPIEYASQLYKNPRGIGCHHCHGDIGQGKLVAIYTHREKKKEFRGPAINNINLNKFYLALNKVKKGMPRYYLTFKEIKALYFFIQENKKVNEDGK